MSPAELFEISLCSTKAAECVKGAKIRASKHEITMTTANQLISVFFGDGRVSFWWDFSTFLSATEMNQKRTIGGHLFEHCTRFWQNVVEIDEFYCRYEDDYPHFETISSLELTEPRDHTISASVMEKLFDKITVVHTLKVLAETDEEYQLKQVQYVEYLELRNAKWMTRDHLLQLKCRVVEIKEHRFTLADLEAFAEYWLSRRGDFFERAYFQWKIDGELKFDRLKTIKFDNSKRGRYFHYSRKDALPEKVDCIDGLDLERADGMLASIVYRHSVSNPAIYFCVWNERFPETPQREVLQRRLNRHYKHLEKINKRYPDTTSLERLLSNRTLTIDEFLDTFKILRNWYLEPEQAGRSTGRERRRSVFEHMHTEISVYLDA
ncbi:unnamed protein product [Caenorhabditis sp. 36 PRJEB53466]|nr:unnamed protein product [Caenorhabditis sp. 36 PRJEB53466]